MLYGMDTVHYMFTLSCPVLFFFNNILFELNAVHVFVPIQLTVATIQTILHCNVSLCCLFHRADLDSNTTADASQIDRK